MTANIETHPLSPFIPQQARLLMLGSFPPPQKRWKMNFYYPNLQNDMWRIFGLVFFGDKYYFFQDKVTFNLTLIKSFLQQQGIAISDTCYQIRRLQNNASDKFLELITPVNLITLLTKMPECQYIMTTGDKATSILMQLMPVGTVTPTIGHSSTALLHGRQLILNRLPSSSRAYPLALERKAQIYHDYFRTIGLIQK